jgi:Holliday junction resolvase
LAKTRKTVRKTKKDRRTAGRPISYSHRYWRESKAKGDEGENAVFGHFERRKYPFQRFVVPDAISKLPLSQEQRLDFASEFKKEFYIDGLARIDGISYAIEIKTKTYPNFVVDVEDYDKLFELSKITPVLVVFYIKADGAIHFHHVRDPYREVAFTIDFQTDEAVYKIPMNELRQMVPAVGVN